MQLRNLFKKRKKATPQKEGATPLPRLLQELNLSGIGNEETLQKLCELKVYTRSLTGTVHLKMVNHGTDLPPYYADISVDPERLIAFLAIEDKEVKQEYSEVINGLDL